MESVRIGKEELLAKIRENLDKHTREFAETVEGYKEQVLADVSKALKLAKAGQDVDFAQLYKLATKPQSFEKDYTRAIKMLEMSKDDVIEISEKIFNQFVMDEWSWKQQFGISASLYSKMKKMQ